MISERCAVEYDQAYLENIYGDDVGKHAPQVGEGMVKKTAYSHCGQQSCQPKRAASS